MYSGEIPKTINNIISFLYRLGIWHRGEEATTRENRIKLFYFVYFLLFLLSVVTGAILSDDMNESIFLTEAAIIITVSLIKLVYLIWKEKEILELLDQIAVYSVKDHDDFKLVNNTLKKFTTFVIFFLAISCFAGFVGTFVPVFGSENKLFLKIGFPLDWKNDDTAFGIACLFIFIEVSITFIPVIFSILIWYLMLTCGLRLIQQLETFFISIFFVQIVTSGPCICGATYSLAFSDGDLVEQLIHLSTLLFNVAEIFVIMYFGNEIMLSSDGLSYCLFESDWTDQPQSCKKYIIIFTELLQQPQELVVGKIYPLTLETFTRILNFAYNSFNILKNFK